MSTKDGISPRNSLAERLSRSRRHRQWAKSKDGTPGGANSTATTTESQESHSPSMSSGSSDKPVSSPSTESNGNNATSSAASSSAATPTGGSSVRESFAQRRQRALQLSRAKNRTASSGASPGPLSAPSPTSTPKSRTVARPSPSSAASQAMTPVRDIAPSTPASSVVSASTPSRPAASANAPSPGSSGHYTPLRSQQQRPSQSPAANLVSTTAPATPSIPKPPTASTPSSHYQPSPASVHLQTQQCGTPTGSTHTPNRSVHGSSPSTPSRQRTSTSYSGLGVPRSSDSVGGDSVNEDNISTSDEQLTVPDLKQSASGESNGPSSFSGRGTPSRNRMVATSTTATANVSPKPSWTPQAQQNYVPSTSGPSPSSFKKKYVPPTPPSHNNPVGRSGIQSIGSPPAAPPQPPQLGPRQSSVSKLAAAQQNYIPPTPPSPSISQKFSTSTVSVAGRFGAGRHSTGSASNPTSNLHGPPKYGRPQTRANITQPQPALTNTINKPRVEVSPEAKSDDGQSDESEVQHRSTYGNAVIETPKKFSVASLRSKLATQSSSTSLHGAKSPPPPPMPMNSRAPQMRHSFPQSYSKQSPGPEPSTSNCELSVDPSYSSSPTTSPTNAADTTLATPSHTRSSWQRQQHQLQRSTSNGSNDLDTAPGGTTASPGILKTGSWNARSASPVSFSNENVAPRATSLSGRSSPAPGIQGRHNTSIGSAPDGANNDKHRQPTSAGVAANRVTWKAPSNEDGGLRRASSPVPDTTAGPVAVPGRSLRDTWEKRTQKKPEKPKPPSPTEENDGEPVSRHQFWEQKTKPPPKTWQRPKSAVGGGVPGKKSVSATAQKHPVHRSWIRGSQSDLSNEAAEAADTDEAETLSAADAVGTYTNSEACSHHGRQSSSPDHVQSLGHPTNKWQSYKSRPTQPHPHPHPHPHHQSTQQQPERTNDQEQQHQPDTSKLQSQPQPSTARSWQSKREFPAATSGPATAPLNKPKSVHSSAAPKMIKRHEVRLQTVAKVKRQDVPPPAQRGSSLLNYWKNRSEGQEAALPEDLKQTLQQSDGEDCSDNYESAETPADVQYNNEPPAFQPYNFHYTSFTKKPVNLPPPQRPSVASQRNRTSGRLSPSLGQLDEQLHQPTHPDEKNDSANAPQTTAPTTKSLGPVLLPSAKSYNVQSQSSESTEPSKPPPPFILPSATGYKPARVPSPTPSSGGEYGSELPLEVASDGENHQHGITSQSLQASVYQHGSEHELYTDGNTPVATDRLRNFEEEDFRAYGTSEFDAMQSSKDEPSPFRSGLVQMPPDKVEQEITHEVPHPMGFLDQQIIEEKKSADGDIAEAAEQVQHSTVDLTNHDGTTDITDHPQLGGGPHAPAQNLKNIAQMATDSMLVVDYHEAKQHEMKVHEYDDDQMPRPNGDCKTQNTEAGHAELQADVQGRSEKTTPTHPRELLEPLNADDTSVEEDPLPPEQEHIAHDDKRLPKLTPSRKDNEVYRSVYYGDETPDSIRRRRKSSPIRGEHLVSSPAVVPDVQPTPPDTTAVGSVEEAPAIADDHVEKPVDVPAGSQEPEYDDQQYDYAEHMTEEHGIPQFSPRTERFVTPDRGARMRANTGPRESTYLPQGLNFQPISYADPELQEIQSDVDSDVVFGDQKSYSSARDSNAGGKSSSIREHSHAVAGWQGRNAHADSQTSNATLQDDQDTLSAVPRLVRKNPESSKGSRVLDFWGGGPPEVVHDDFAAADANQWANRDPDLVDFSEHDHSPTPGLKDAFHIDPMNHTDLQAPMVRQDQNGSTHPISQSHPAQPQLMHQQHEQHNAENVGETSQQMSRPANTLMQPPRHLPNHMRQPRHLSQQRSARKSNVPSSPSRLSFSQGGVVQGATPSKAARSTQKSRKKDVFDPFNDDADGFVPMDTNNGLFEAPSDPFFPEEAFSPVNWGTPQGRAANMHTPDENTPNGRFSFSSQPSPSRMEI